MLTKVFVCRTYQNYIAIAHGYYDSVKAVVIDFVFNADENAIDNKKTKRSLASLYHQVSPVISRNYDARLGKAHRRFSDERIAN